MPDGTPAVNSSDPKATRAFNLCHFRYSINFEGKNCQALNNTTCRGYGFVGKEVQPKAPSETFDRPGWQEFTNGLVQCEAGPPRAATLSEYQGAARLNYLVPIATIEAQGPIPPPAVDGKEAEPHDTHD